MKSTYIAEDSISTFVPKYQFGKIKSKYLITEVITYSGYRDELYHILFETSTKLRQLLIQEYQLIKMSACLIEGGPYFKVDKYGLITNALTPAACNAQNTTMQVDDVQDLMKFVTLRNLGMLTKVTKVKLKLNRWNQVGFV